MRPRSWIALFALMSGCARPAAYTDPYRFDLVPQGRTLRMELAAPAHVAVYEMIPSASLIRISPDTALPVDHIDLSRPNNMSRYSSRDFSTPTVRVESWGGYGTLLGETTGHWDRAYVSWEELPRAVVPVAPRTVWLVAFLDGPLSPAADSQALRIVGRPLFRAVDAAHELSATLGLPDSHVRVVPVR